MSPIQQMLLGVGAVATKTYVDDVFSTQVYTGSGTNGRLINNGIDLATEGGMVWSKARNYAANHGIFDTERGAHKFINSNSTATETTAAQILSAFNSNGYTVDNDGSYSLTNNADNNETFSSWTFRKAKGFFDVVTYTGVTGGGSAQTINHNLGCIPGLIIIKSTGYAGGWAVYHRDLGKEKYILLNTNAEAQTDSSNYYWNNVAPTATQFTVGTDWNVNKDSQGYVAYLFAGGESTAATARSVEFDHNGDYLSCTHGSAGSSDFSVGTGDFTIECWIKISDPDQYHGVFQVKDGTLNTSGVGTHLAVVWRGNNHTWQVYGSDATTESPVRVLKEHQWQHVALVRASSKTTLYINGIPEISQNDTVNYDHHGLTIGAVYNSTIELLGNVSNFRFVKGTAVYTSAFRPPTEPLTNITNTKLLCCQNSTTTGSTVIPSGSSITANGDPTASTDSPFDDPAGFAFGDSADQNLIKCGSYVGNGSSTGPEINLGWEPQWILLKNADATKDWKLFDCMRGLSTNAGDDRMLSANVNSVEIGADVIDITSTGFKPVSDSQQYNGDGHDMIYIAIRRPDGYVGKPPELGTDVFAMDTGNSSESIPVFDSGFPVDFAFMRIFADSQEWYTSARLFSGKRIWTQSTDDEESLDGMTFDSNSGWASKGTTYSWGNTYQSWMWKRHAGFDCISYKGDGVAGKQIPHSLSKIPEMIWIKNSDRGEAWRVYHKGLNGGTTPHNYGLKLNTTDDESAVTIWNQTAPTSTHFTINADSGVNHSGEDMRAFLFASVEGISKVGYYTGNGSTQTITTGFAPRFAIIRRVDGSEDHWLVLDTTRGWASGDDKGLKLNENHAQGTSEDYGAPTSTGFSLTSNGWVNYDTGKFIYYAHA